MNQLWKNVSQNRGVEEYLKSRERDDKENKIFMLGMYDVCERFGRRFYQIPNGLPQVYINYPGAQVTAALGAVKVLKSVFSRACSANNRIFH
jgi:hypothetical protein